MEQLGQLVHDQEIQVQSGPAVKERESWSSCDIVPWIAVGLGAALLRLYELGTRLFRLLKLLKPYLLSPRIPLQELGLHRPAAF